MGLAFIYFWPRSLLEAPKWVKDPGNGLKSIRGSWRDHLALLPIRILHYSQVAGDQHEVVDASLSDGVLAQIDEAEQGHHVPVGDPEVDHGMRVGVGGKDVPEELTCCPQYQFVSV